MRNFQVYKPENAPDASSRRLLDSAKLRVGSVPVLYAYLAESPPTLQAYVDLSARFEQTAFSSAERQALLLAMSVENGCEFCMAAHSVAARIAGVPSAVVDAMRAMQPVQDAHYGTLITFAQTVARQHGWVQGPPLQTFFGHGFTSRQALEVVLTVAMTTLSDYVDLMTGMHADPKLST